ncbi:hypothetical protein BO71DRAFT_470628 [Aspergillus ellipticus CBS 707.79]|uniref:Berberine/berberine-like domain-containing protein n=1 Tax=Aspergillus ellipticus CBS 707.79 TaxID=1448320 RepID=A0A319CTN1_9EURO|nr:hypothetical protein BO71DRAFT_470628 [Aspergillus ellipticus CBS 707.79]
MARSTSLTISTFDNYYAFFDAYFGPLPFGSYTNAQVQGGRLIPRTVLAKSADNAALTAALRTIAPNPAFHIVGIGADVSTRAFVPNAVFPGWRTAGSWIEIAANWDYDQTYATNAVNETLITDDYVPLLQAVSGPDSGAYMNEADPHQPDFQSQFFGDIYARLRSIKNVFDPNHIFYGNALVGSDEWVLGADGRLCRA